MRRVILAFASLVAAVGCSDSTTQQSPQFHDSGNPPLLSDWGVFATGNGTLTFNDGVAPYDIATPLFSDYALKLRTVSLPDGQSASINADSILEFPVGTIITKTFYYPTDGAEWSGVVRQSDAVIPENGAMALEGLRLVETRVLARRESGWIALPYVWNDEQTNAALKRTGDIINMTLVRSDGRRDDFPYVVPNVNQCSGCHATNATTKAIEPIGMKVRHLNKESTFDPGQNQLDYWTDNGLLAANIDNQQALPRNALWGSSDAGDLDHLARSYLDSNCSHCHNPNGAADTSGLNLEPDADGPALGFCKPPIAAGGGSGGRPYDIVPGNAAQSITVFRMETDDPGAMMPELGRSLVHEEGVALIAEWINAMSGDCS